MTHEAAVLWIPDALSGKLDRAARDGVLEHVAGCPDCRSLSETYVTIAAAVGDPGDERHPSSAKIVAYAVEAGGLDADARARIATHVETCASCSMEVEATRGAEVEVGTAVEVPALARSAAPPAFTKHRGPALRIAVAAAVVAGALAYPAYRGLVELPRTVERADRLSSWGGAVELPVLRSLRDARSEPQPVEVAASQPVVALGVELDPSETEGDKRPVRFGVVNAAGRRVWSLDRTADEVSQYARATGVVTLLVPTASLPEGSFFLRVERVDGAASEPVLEAPFAIRYRPAATKAPQ